MNDIRSHLTKLEELVHSYANAVRNCRRTLLKALKNRKPEIIRKTISMVIKLSKDIEEVLRNIIEVTEFENLDPELSERLNLLTFFLIEAGFNMEKEVWQLYRRVCEKLGIQTEFDIDTQINRLDALRELANNIFSRTKLCE